MFQLWFDRWMDEPASDLVTPRNGQSANQANADVAFPATIGVNFCFSPGPQSDKAT